jgi:SAM-dependent methyltransferase
MTQSRLLRFTLKLLGPLWRWRRFGLWSEELFWARAFRDPAYPEPWLLDPTRPVSDEIRQLLAASDSKPLRILEVGAGPITVMGLVHPDRELEITPTDLLAEQYDRLLKRRGIEPPVRTIYANAEQLAGQFGASRFDLVFASNCIDHTERPLTAIREMLAVTKPGGYVLMYHEPNEGQHQDYAGLHQWNLAEREGHFVVWNRSESHDVTKMLQPGCDTEVGMSGELLRVLIHKLATPRP